MPGAEWKGIIDAHLSTADIILLFVSPDFFQSDYCYDVEMTAALERHRRGDARVVPIILRPSTWQAAPFAALNVLPTDGVPVTKWPNRDDACLDIAKGVVLVVQELLAHSDPNRPERASGFRPLVKRPLKTRLCGERGDCRRARRLPN